MAYFIKHKALISEEWIGTRSTKGKFTFLLNILAVTYSTLLPSPVSTTKCEIYMPCKEKNVLQKFFYFSFLIIFGFSLRVKEGDVGWRITF